MNSNNDGLFKTTGDSLHLSCLNFTGHAFDLYAEGYLTAGNILVDHIQKNDQGMDTLVYPIIFNYRHYLELRLKEIIWKGRELLDKNGRYPINHNLAELWNVAKPLISLTWEGTPEPEEYEIIGVLVADFATIDAASDAFRFPEDRDGKKHLEGIKYLDTAHIKFVFDKVSRFLEGVSGGINDYLDYQASRSGD